jgi:hypothetical protein
MKSIKIGDMRTRNFFKFTFKKVIIDLVISIVLVYLIFFSVPLYKNMFLRESFARQVIDIVVNFVVYMAIFYTPSCYLSLFIFKGERK